MSEKTIRAFIAVEIPNEETLDEILKYQGLLQKSIGSLKLVKRELMHITLRFLGDISENNARLIHRFLQNKINDPLFSGSDDTHMGSIVGAGDFNNRVFFVKTSGVADLLDQIHSKIEAYLHNIPEIKPDNKPFRAHLTIARAKKQYQKKNRGVSNPGQINYSKLKDQFANTPFGSFNVVKVVLKQSTLTPQGPIYKDVEF